MNIAGTAHYKGKLTFLFVLVGIAAVLSPVAIGLTMRGIASEAKQIYSDVPTEGAAMEINAAVKRYQANADEVRKSLASLNATIYEDRDLQGTIAEELRCH